MIKKEKSKDIIMKIIKFINGLTKKFNVIIRLAQISLRKEMIIKLIILYILIIYLYIFIILIKIVNIIYKK